MMEQISALVVEVKEMYKRQICWSNSSHTAHNSSLQLTAVMKSIILFFVIIAISLGLAKRHKPVLPARTPATSLNTAWPSDSLIDKEVRKTKAMLGTETWFRPCDCGGPGWEKIAFYDFSQQECPHNFTRQYGEYNDISCRATSEYSEGQGTSEYRACGHDLSSSSLPLPVGRAYSSVCGRVRGHGWGMAFYNVITCNRSLEQTYVFGVSLTHGTAGRRTHIWTFAAALADGGTDTSSTKFYCGCSNTGINWTHTTPEDVGNDYFCDSNVQFTEGGRSEGEDYDDDLWDGKGCGPGSSCCEWNDPPYFCKHLHSTTSEDMELRLFSLYFSYTPSTSIRNYSPTVSLIEIFVQ